MDVKPDRVRTYRRMFNISLTVEVILYLLFLFGVSSPVALFNLATSVVLVSLVAELVERGRHAPHNDQPSE